MIMCLHSSSLYITQLDNNFLYFSTLFMLMFIFTIRSTDPLCRTAYCVFSLLVVALLIYSSSSVVLNIVLCELYASYTRQPLQFVGITSNTNLDSPSF